MVTNVAILRGINVGGKRSLKMAELKDMLLEMGFQEPQTYIQSGNVIFKTGDAEENEDLENRIEDAIRERFDMDVPVIVRGAAELDEAILDNPFYKGGEDDAEGLHLTLLSEIPSEERLKEIESKESGTDKFEIKDANVFIYCPGPYHKTKFSNSFFEKKLGVKATTRNWKTILKLSELSGNEQRGNPT